MTTKQHLEFNRTRFRALLESVDVQCDDVERAFNDGNGPAFARAACRAAAEIARLIDCAGEFPTGAEGDGCRERAAAHVVWLDRMLSKAEGKRSMWGAS